MGKYKDKDIESFVTGHGNNRVVGYAIHDAEAGDKVAVSMCNDDLKRLEVEMDNANLEHKLKDYYAEVNADREQKYKLIAKLKGISNCLNGLRDDKSELESSLFKELNYTIDRILELKYTEDM